MSTFMLKSAFRVKFIIPVLYILATTLPLAAEAIKPITESNWSTHPRIVEIRELCGRIDKGIAGGTIHERKKPFDYASPRVAPLKILYIDGRNIVRKFVEEAASEDSALRFNYYYDPAGKLRFVFITGGAVNGSKMEHRIYFNAEGTRIWEIQKYTSGPGYTFPKTWPEKDIVINPAEEFNK